MRLASGFRLGSIAGVAITIDWSLLLIVFLITFSLAAGVFPAWHPEWSAALSWTTALAAAVLFFASVLAHELSHALVGRAVGVEIRRITLFMFGGMAHMESEPPSWRAELGMAIVGPVTSLVLGVAFLAVAAAMGGTVDVAAEDPQAALAALGPLASLLLWLGPVNIILGLFNLVPGFPLDGGRVLRAAMWGITGDLLRATRWASRAGQGFAWVLMSIGFAMIVGLRVPLFGGGLVNGLWLAFIGWFLNNAAIMSYRQMLVRESLADVPVRSLMLTRYVTVNPDVTVATIVNEHLMSSGQRAFPVEDQGRFIGIVSLRDVSKCNSNDWPVTPVGDIMMPAGRLATIGPETDAAEALELLARNDVNQIPVVRDEQLLGLLRREDIVTWLALRGGPQLTGTRGQAASPG